MKIAIDVVYALPDAQSVIRVEIDEGADLAQAVAASGILKRHPELDLATLRVGVWGRIVPPTHRLQQRDRVEIYRPLTADPKQVRRQRAAGEQKPGRKR